MTSETLLEPPARLKAIQSFMRVASDVDRVDPVVSYWVRFYCVETALKVDQDSPESKKFLLSLISWLESFKEKHKENEAVSNQTVGQAHVENFIVALFNKVDTMDRDGVANAKTVRMFYTSAVLFEAMAVFGPLTEEITKRAKYSKFKAAYITKCLKSGQTPKPGPLEGSDLDPSQGEQPDGGAGGGPPASLDDNSAPTPLTPAASMPMPGSSEPFVMTPTSSMPVYPKPSDTGAPPPVPTTTKPASTTAKSCTSPSAGPQTSIGSTRFVATNGTALSPEDVLQGQKYCKFANSALQYDDIPTAVSNLEKALKLLTTGQRPE